MEPISLETCLFFLIVLLLISLWLRNTKVGTLTLFSLFFMLGILRINAPSELSSSNDYLLRKATINRVLTPNSHYYRYEATLENTPRTPLLLWIKKPQPKPPDSRGDRILFYGSVEKISFPKNPGFDYTVYLKNRGIHYRAELFYYRTLKPQKGLRRFLEQLRKKRVQAIDSWELDPWEKSLFSALTLGYKDTQFRELQATYTRVGMSHILAISGLHLGLLFGGIYFLFVPISLFPNGKKMRFILALITLWLVALFVGLGASVLRSALMISFFGLGKLVHRPNPPIHALILACLTTLIINPLELFSIGFQLSYSAVLSLLVGYPLVLPWIQSTPKIVRPPLQLMSVSVLAQLGVVTLSLYYFGGFSGLFLIGNFMLIPLLSVELFLYYSLLLGSWISPNIQGLITISKWTLSTTNGIVTKLSHFDFWVLENVSIDPFTLGILYLLLFFLFNGVEKRSSKFIKGFLCCILVLQAHQLYLEHQWSRREWLLLFQRPKNSLVGYLKGRQLRLYYTNQPDPTFIALLKKEYRIKEVYLQEMGYGFQIGEIQLLRMDCSGVVIPPKNIPSYLLIEGNPSVNLDRILDTYSYKLLIISNSNSAFSRLQWSRTADIKKLPLYDLSQKGVFILKVK